jgi:proteic killer suppression protein
MWMNEVVTVFCNVRGNGSRRSTPRLNHAATGMSDLQALPSNALKELKGDRKGQYSIGINMQWRICFEWPEAQCGASNVEIVDYH